ncbi:unnamed protein product [Lactuca saligna]|uniref:Uncharacterized protein n=1 Tax=Lactuca saligna TaxID=75948 RepID=A0AA35ZLK2_LACSI|nr:unnamed protein product [Lactuca saligna]
MRKLLPREALLPHHLQSTICICQASQATFFSRLYSSVKRKGNTYWLRTRRLTTLYLDLKEKLIGKFGDDFKNSGSNDGKASETSERAMVSPAPDSNVDQFLSSGPITDEERRGNQRKIDKLRKDKMLLMKNSDQNAPSDHPKMFIKEIRKRKLLIDLVGNIEYYAKKIGFVSWIKVDLVELVHELFHNPTNDPKAWAFKKFQEDKAKQKFEGLKTTSLFVKKVKGVTHPRTNKTMVNVMWPPTNKAKRIPITQCVPNGSLNDLLYWVYDEATSIVVIKMKKDQIHLVDSKALLKFGEHEIHTLFKHQLVEENEMFEAAAKDFTSMIATIIDKRLWAGALANSDGHLVENP